ncbi:zinc finger protein 239-like [Phlebotomus papatasi]|uniref:zinc finger protein 239-like n=1 Tax=Phlebotomus papatasi TaxID=29031 RepID=UPI0024836895|nr:zinc finger protein 239-like [Phlebotomus papatasi]
MIENFEPLKEHGYSLPYWQNSHLQDEVKQEIEETEERTADADETNEIPNYVRPTASEDFGSSRSNILEIKSKKIKEKRPQKPKQVKKVPKEKRARRKSSIKRGIFNCMLCNKVFHTGNSLRQHMTTIHLKTRECQCSVCGKKFSTKAMLQRHEPIHDKNRATYSCKYCNKTFFKSPKEHMWLIHSIPHNVQDRICICQYCNATLEDRLAYYEHLKCHSLEKYTCRSCSKEFSSLDLLGEHEVTHIDTRPYVCEICAKTYKNMKSLSKHINLHCGGKKRYECDYCGKKFSTSFNRKLHVRLHTGETPYECTKCLKQFHDKRICAKHFLKCSGNPNKPNMKI